MLQIALFALSVMAEMRSKMRSEILTEKTSHRVVICAGLPVGTAQGPVSISL